MGTTINLINPFSGTLVQLDAAEFTQAQISAYVKLLEEDEMEEINRVAETPAEWMVAMTEVVGAERAGQIVLGS